MKLPYWIVCTLTILTVGFAPHTASAKCVARAFISANGKPGSILAIAPDSGSTDLDASGFREADCGSLDKTAYRAKICAPENIGNHGIRRQFELQAGVTFAQLCNAARKEAGLPEQSTSTARSWNFSPTNRRPPVARGGPSLVGPLGGANSATKGN